MVSKRFTEEFKLESIEKLSNGVIRLADVYAKLDILLDSLIPE